MGSLTAASSIALRALLVDEGALQVTTNNIANAQTPGYSRQRPVLLETTPYYDGNLVQGTGVELNKVESVRDRVLEMRLNEQTQQQGGLDAYLAGMQQVELLFDTSSTNSIGNLMDSFFSSLTGLSNDPTSMPLRQSVLVAAGNLAAGFRTTSEDLTSTQQSLDREFVQEVNSVNQLAGQIAATNQEVSRLEKLGKDTSAFEDQRTQLIRQLSQVAEISLTDSDDGVTITTRNGAMLVVGNQSFSLTTEAGSDGLTRVLSQGKDVTGDFSAGSLGGILRARDTSIPDLRNQLDNLAYNLANALNAVHTSGFDLNGAAGDNLFEPLGTAAGAAAALQLHITDPSKIAASTDGSAGENANLLALIDVQKSKVVDGQTATDAFANTVFSIGQMVANAQPDQKASQLMLQQLQNERAAVSGVSLDEEAANLLKYQRAYEAAARVINAVDELTQITLTLGAQP